MTEVDDLRQDFRTSSRFGVIGVVVVMVVTAALALAFGSGTAKPTVLIAVILGIVFAFVAVLMILQRRDLDRAEERSTRAALEAAEPVTDPTTADANSLLQDLAIKPVDRTVLADSSSRVWSITRGSMNSAVVLVVLIFCAVVPWQLFTAYWSIYVFVPIIVVYLLYLVARLLMPGGTLDQAYASSAPMLDALGLAQLSRPELSAGPRIGPGLEKRMTGEVAYSGTRHGRSVTVTIPVGGPTTTVIGGSFPRLDIAARGERLTAEPRAPTAVDAVLAPLRPSSYWKGVAITAGADGLVVERKHDGGLHWMRDLWLAERLADALSRPA